jgi:hypothetical protein
LAWGQASSLEGALSLSNQRVGTFT